MYYLDDLIFNRCCCMLKVALGIINSALIIIGIIVSAVGIVLLYCAGNVGTDLLSKDLGYVVIAVGLFIIILAAVGMASYLCCKYVKCLFLSVYTVAILLILIVELFFALSVMVIMDKVDVDTWPMGDVKDTFDKGINATYRTCCLNTTVEPSSCDFFPNLCNNITGFDDAKARIVDDLKQYTDPVLAFIFIVIVLAATCCVKTEKER